MKIITIYQEGADPIIVDDDDDEELVSYIKKISSMFEYNNISILQTKFTSVITRPSKIISIVVNEQEVKEIPVKIKTKDVIQSKKHSKKKEPAEKDEYTLTDEE
jgi:transcriptional regulator with PAS, ATPase and Fis domain